MAKKLELDEATRRIAERMLGTPPKRHEEMKVGKGKPKRKNPTKRKAAKKRES